MGYWLKIGEYKPGISDVGLVVTPDVVKLDNAPAGGLDFDYTNQFECSYGVWDDFINATGLNVLFNDRTGQLIRKENQPGYAELTKDYQRIINLAYASKNKIQEDYQFPLEWLKFWVDWALENCKKPVFVNK